METTKPINPSSTIAFWNDFAEKYKSIAEESGTMQGSATCFAMVNTQKPGQKILEVGCGTGVGSLAFASVFLRDKSVLVSTDFCPEMVNKLKERYDENGFGQISGNVLVIDAETDHTKEGSAVDIDAIVASQNDFKKFVYGCRASGIALPFSDASFDGYASSLVLQLISDPAAQLKEAFRVLKPNSRACFAVWGRKTMSLNFTTPMIARNKLGVPLSVVPGTPSNFDCSENMDKTRQLILDAGFSHIKFWNQACCWPCFTGEQFVKTHFAGLKPDET